MRTILLFIALCFFAFANAQISVTNDGSKADKSAMLDVKSISKGVLVPRMTSIQRYSIYDPATGLLVFDSDTGSFWFYDGDTWKEIQGSKSTDPWVPHANGIFYNKGNVGIGMTASPIIPLTVFMRHTGLGNAPLHVRSDDSWHTAVGIFNGDTSAGQPIQKEYSFILAGPSNTDALPGSFGLLNHQNSLWAFNVHPTTNDFAIGSLEAYKAASARSRLHVYGGDVNIC